MDGSPGRFIRVRYQGHCVACGAEFAAGSRASWNAAKKELTCQACATPRPEAGASAQREYDRRRERREEQIAKRSFVPA